MSAANFAGATGDTRSHGRRLRSIAALPDEDAAFQLARLPRLHRDPFDRMLICQAISHGLTIVTPDPLIRQYPIRVMW
jgi:PIN domain nuclease of toxin-antitoxin system